MTVFEPNFSPDGHVTYLHDLKLFEVPMKRKISLHDVTEAAGSMDAPNSDVVYSPTVHRLFVASLMLLILSGLTSIVGVVTEDDPASFVGAALLCAGLLFLLSWATQANVERQAWTDR